MKAIPLEESLISAVQKFLEKYEYSCVSLCSRVRKREDGIFVLSEKDAVSSAEDIFGVIAVSEIINHCLPFIKKENALSDDFFLELFQGKKISCVNGEKIGTEYLVNLFLKNGRSVFHQNEYYLMTHEDLDGFPPPASLLSMGEEIVCCKSDHEDDLLPLQKNYLMEEVIPNGAKPKDEYARLNIKRILREQKVFAIFSDGEFVAKANTNAIGWKWVQIGGVYTNPLYRRNNYARCLISTLGRRINKTGRKTCLFVNKKNLPAMSLYKKMNFQEKCDFQICYLEKNVTP